MTTIIPSQLERDRPPTQSSCISESTVHRARSSVRSYRMVGVHRPCHSAGPNRSRPVAKRPLVPHERNLLASSQHLFPATPFPSSVQQAPTQGCHKVGPGSIRGAGLGAADQRWARRPRRSILEMQRLRGLIHLFRRHCQPNKYCCTTTLQGLRSERCASDDYGPLSDYGARIGSREILPRVVSLS